MARSSAHAISAMVSIVMLVWPFNRRADDRTDRTSSRRSKHADDRIRPGEVDPHEVPRAVGIVADQQSVGRVVFPGVAGDPGRQDLAQSPTFMLAQSRGMLCHRRSSSSGGSNTAVVFPASSARSIGAALFIDSSGSYCIDPDDSYCPVAMKPRDGATCRPLRIERIFQRTPTASGQQQRLACGRRGKAPWQSTNPSRPAERPLPTPRRAAHKGHHDATPPPCPGRPRAYAPDPAAPPGRACDMPGCPEAGEYRAPKSRTNLNDYHWFCLEHVRAYNAGWDFYKGMSPAEVEAQLRADTSWQRPTWPIGSLGYSGVGRGRAEGPAAHPGRGADEGARSGRTRTRRRRNCGNRWRRWACLGRRRWMR